MSDIGGIFNKSKYIIDNLDRAIEEEWLEVYYQPIIRTSNGRVCGEEALIRWEDPVLGMLNPMDFVPALEAVNAVHRLDLYVLEKTLQKMEDQRKRGLYVVPTSVNLSQVDFYTCDIVEEVTRRVEESKISRRLIAIEVSERSLTIGNDFVISQLEQFRDLGFQVWMDDYGSGDTALTILQNMHFDALKINMFYVQQISKSERARIILTELVRLAMSLGMETVIEGVEFENQVEFLQEIGCTKLQGFYYCKPIPSSKIFERYEKGMAIGFENPDESSYYSAVGRIGLYDLSFARSNNNELANYFDSFPIAIVETDGKTLRIIRDNNVFRTFVSQNIPGANTSGIYRFDDSKKANEDKEDVKTVGIYTLNCIRNCAKTGKRAIIDDRMPDGNIVQILLQRIAVNPVTKVSAVVIAILQVNETQSNTDSLTYNYIARALSEDYIDMYFVDMESGDYVEFNPDGYNRDVAVERRGTDFFRAAESQIKKRIYAEDVDIMLKSFTKRNIKKTIEEQGSYTLTYRLMMNGKPTYVNLKAVRIRTDNRHIIIGINNVDSQVRQQEIIERANEERLMYSRVMALSGDFICFYSVDPETEHYVCFTATQEFEKLNIPTEGDEFFGLSRDNSRKVVHPKDLKDYLKVFTKENILNSISKHGVFIYNYRFLINGVITHVCLKATLVKEKTGDKLIVGIIDVENQVLMEQEYAANLKEAEDKATKDQLTGVKNKRAYVDEEEYLNVQISVGNDIQFAIVVCDINGLKQVNDNMGHAAGDAYIKEGCEMICDAFSRSPVFRIGGDEFVAVVQGKDYEYLESRIERIGKANAKNKKNGKVTIAIGYSVYDKKDKFVSDVFERADSLMYANKKKMKAADKNV